MAKTMVEKLVEALQPFVLAFERDADPMGDLNRFDQQPKFIRVAMGDLWRARAVLVEAESYLSLNEARPVGEVADDVVSRLHPQDPAQPVNGEARGHNSAHNEAERKAEAQITEHSAPQAGDLQPAPAAPLPWKDR